MAKLYLVCAILFTLASGFYWESYLSNCSNWLVLISAILTTLTAIIYWLIVAREYKYKK